MQIQKIILILSLMLFQLCGSLFGQSISGRISDRNGSFLEFVNVTLLRGDTVIVSTFTDSLGNYRIDYGRNDNFIIKASLVGFIQWSDSFYLEKDTIVDISLEVDSPLLEGVKVIGKKPLIERKVDRLIFNIEGNPNFAGLDAIEVLMRAPLLDVRDNTIKRIGGMLMTVMIDGRFLGNLDPTSIANRLRGIPAESILRVEIITNPGAEYDAEGIGGIVNIVLKKAKTLGYSGSISAAYTRINNDDLFRSGIDFNYNFKKLRTFFNFGTSTGRALTVSNIDIFYPSHTWSSNGYRYEYQKPFISTIGFEYDFSKKSSFGFSLNPLFSYPDQEGVYSIVVSDPGGNGIDSTIETNNDTRINYRNYSINMHFNQVLDSAGGQLGIDIDMVKNRYGNDITNNSASFNSFGLLKHGSEFQYVSENRDQSDLLSLNLVVKRAREKYTLTYGTKLTFIGSDQRLNQYRIVFDPQQTDTLTENWFKANQNIQAVFGNYQRKFKKFEFKAGLRAENTQLVWVIPNSPSSDRRSFFNIFPSFNLGYEMNEVSAIAFGFNRRFSRPGFSSLNPTLVYVNAYRFYKGNPDLVPYFSTTFELSYTYKGNLSLGLSYVFTPHSIYGVSSFDSNSNIVVDNFFNYISSRYYSFDAFYSLNKIKNLQSNFVLSVYRSQFASSLPQTGANFKRWSGSFRSSNTYYINKSRTLIAGLIFSYQLADLSGISITKARYYFDVSLRYSLLQGKVDISFAGRDILKTNNFSTSSIVNDIMERSFTNDRSRRFGLTVRYNFGNSKIKKGVRYNGIGGDQSVISK